MAVPYLPGAMLDVMRNRYKLVKDEYNNETRSPSDVDHLLVTGCCWQPKQGDEFLQDADRFIVRGDLYLPREADLWGTDTVTVPGVGELTVDGPVERWPDVGGLGHVHVSLVWYREEPDPAPDPELEGGGAVAPEFNLEGGDADLGEDSDYLEGGGA